MVLNFFKLKPKLYFFLCCYEKLPLKLRDYLYFKFRVIFKESFYGLFSDPLKKEDVKLWGGFSASAIQELKKIKKEGSDKQASKASWYLFRWFCANRDFDLALKNIEEARLEYKKLGCQAKQIIPEANMLVLNNRHEEGRSLLQNKQDFIKSRVNFYMAISNTWVGVDEAQSLIALNRMFSEAGYLKIEKIDKNLMLSIDNIRCVDVKNHVVDDGVKVTVIVPVYNGAEKITTALLSLKNQTWRNIEVIIVDDCSIDATEKVVKRFCEKDSRFVYLKNKQNSGSYFSRNHALQIATGDLVTIHDADDWSHAQKIEAQVRDLTSSKKPYNFSYWTRVSDDLFCWGTASRPGTHGNLATLNHSSALFYLDEIKALGGWDTVRIAADNELIRRYERQLGLPVTSYLTRGCQNKLPLSFGRLDFNSLTQNKLTHVVTAWHGMRKEYRERAEFWYDQVFLSRRKQRFYGYKPPFFTSPESMKEKTSVVKHVNKIYIGDFSKRKSSALALADINMGEDKSACGFFSYPDYSNYSTVSYSFDVRKYAYENNIYLCVPGEMLRAKEVVVLEPRLFAHKLDRFPRIEADKVMILSKGKSNFLNDKVLGNISREFSMLRDSLEFLVESD